MQTDSFFNRDISWLSFNERVLMEAEKETIPLIERAKFLSIYSSNLDEFYRVRMPVLMALQKLSKQKSSINEYADIFQQVKNIIQQQQKKFGKILTQQILPQLKKNGIYVLYNEQMPDIIESCISEYFFTQVLGFLQPVYLSDAETVFFPENNKLYLVAITQQKNKKEDLIIINIPSDNLPRFYSINLNDTQYIIFLDDIIKANLQKVFKHATIKACYNFKITRDAELELQDEFEGDIADKIEKQIAKRDFGLATRFLYEPGLPLRCLQSIINDLNLSNANIVEGGVYHNLKDFASLSAGIAALSYIKWPPIQFKMDEKNNSLLEYIEKKDIILHAPYQSYDTVLRFFNEAAIDADVEEIYVTLYRIASDSRIANALISAAKNGKKVTVFVELKARFDEANNIRWAKKMKAAGVKIIYSIPSLKVHAKVALVKRKKGERVSYFGLLATGNLNENTARFYTDHVLLTTHHEMLRETELLFIFLAATKNAGTSDFIQFNHLLVAQFNLQKCFLDLIDREILYAKQGLPAGIIIKLNNLEEKVLINKLYEASCAGVKISLIVRTICCLIPGVKDISENITITRIVDRYLEHGRIFIFHNNGNEELYLGSADWMNRNIYHRIEVCFPVYDEEIKKEIIEMIKLQLQDNVQAVKIDDALNNIPIESNEEPVQSQEAIYTMLKNKLNTNS
jgi:polyphosphate kinase